ncbi:MAG: 23S rRNA (adenine(2503)-C(2))-methyltransferase RlmN [bacterium]
MENIKRFSFEELLGFIRDEKEPDYRARQIWQWIYQKGVTSFDHMLNLSVSFRERLKDCFFISCPTIDTIAAAEDGTKKLLISLQDKIPSESGAKIETVIIPDKKRTTVCVSTQIGCKQGCKFCLTGKAGFTRDLYAYEICDQIALAQRCCKTRISNIVLMGMGEPLDNYENTIQAIRIMTSSLGFSFSPKRITLSTVGLVPKIKKLYKEKLKIKLAISLNAATDAIRDDIMPINRKYPLSQLIECIRAYTLKTGERITLEYVLIGAINDSPVCAEQLVKLLRNLKIKINLIPYNKNPYLPFSPPETEAVMIFFNVLKKHNYHATIRESKGAEIFAACGQLGYLILI